MEKDNWMEALQPTLKSVEEFRKKQLSLQKLQYGFFALGGILLLFAFISFKMSFTLFAGILLGVFVVLLIAISSIVGTPEKAYQDKYINEVIRGLVKTLDPAIKYTPNSYKYHRFIEKSGLIGSSVFSEPGGLLLDGKTKNNYPFQLITANLIRSSVNNTGYSGPHKGLICMIEGTHYLGEYTVITPRSVSTGSTMSIKRESGKGETILTLLPMKEKHVAFNDKCVVYTKKRSQGNELLTKEVLQKINTLMDSWKVPFNIVLKGNELLVFLPGINPFEGNINLSLLGRNVVVKAQNKMKSCLDLAEELSSLIGGENRMKITQEEQIEPLKNSDNSAYDHFIDHE